MRAIPILVVLVAATALAPLASGAVLVPDAAPHTGAWTIAIDGDTVVLGQSQRNAAALGEEGPYRGVAYVFEREGGSWRQVARLEAPDGREGDEFGVAVGVSGATIVVGAAQNNATGERSGAAYVFEKEDGAWTFRQKLAIAEASKPWYESFGQAVAVDGDTILVGDRGKLVFHDEERGLPVASESGSVHVFRRTGAGWEPTQRIYAPDAGPVEAFGTSVALDGETALVGGSLGYRSKPGLAYLMGLRAGVWEVVGQLRPPSAQDDMFYGRSVALKGDVAVVGGSTVHVFTREGQGWSHAQALDRSTTGVATDGESVAWSGAVAVREGGVWQEVAWSYTDAVAMADGTLVVGRGGGAETYARDELGWLPELEERALRGTIRAFDGTAAAMAFVHAGTSAGTLADRHGRYVVTPIAEGNDGTITVDPPPGSVLARAQCACVTVPPSGVTWLNVTLYGGGLLGGNGTVKNASTDAVLSRVPSGSASPYAQVRDLPLGADLVLELSVTNPHDVQADFDVPLIVKESVAEERIVRLDALETTTLSYRHRFEGGYDVLVRVGRMGELPLAMLSAVPPRDNEELGELLQAIPAGDAALAALALGAIALAGLRRGGRRQS